MQYLRKYTANIISVIESVIEFLWKNLWIYQYVRSTFSITQLLTVGANYWCFYWNRVLWTSVIEFNYYLITQVRFDYPITIQIPVYAWLLRNICIIIKWKSILKIFNWNRKHKWLFFTVQCICKYQFKHFIWSSTSFFANF